MKYNLLGPDLSGAMPQWQEVEQRVPSGVLLSMRLNHDFPGMLLCLGLAGVFEPQPESAAVASDRERPGGDHWTGTYTSPDRGSAPMRLHANDPGWRPFGEASKATLEAVIFWDRPLHA